MAARPPQPPGTTDPFLPGTRDPNPKPSTMGRVVNFTFFGLSVGAYLLFILAFSTPFWYERGNESFGLFKECYREAYGMDWICTYADFGEMAGGTIGSMALLVIALLPNTAAFIMCILVIVNSEKFKVFIGAILFGVGGLIQVIGVGVFGGNFDGDTENIGWSFALCCVSMAVQIIASIAIILADRLGNNQQT